MSTKRPPRGKPGLKADREALRRDMLKRGSSVSEVSVEMASRWGFRPRAAWRHALGLTQDEAAERYNNLCDVDAARMTGKRISEYENWPLGGTKPPMYFLIRLAEAYGAPSVAAMTDYHDKQSMTAEDCVIVAACAHADGARSTIDASATGASSPGDTASNASSAHHSRQRVASVVEVHRSPGHRQGAIGDIVMSAADESARDAAAADSSNVGDATLDELTAEAIQLARSFLNGDVLAQFYEALRIRKRVQNLLDGRQYPRQTSQLYYQLGVLSCLLADASHNLGYPGAAGEQARAAWTYGEILGHTSMKAWVRSFQSVLAERAGMPRKAIGLAESGLELTRSPVARILLHHRAAIASAQLGDAQNARRMVARALDIRDDVRGEDELFEQVGGMFSCPEAKQQFLAASVHVELGLPEEGEGSAASCIEMYETGRPEDLAQGCLTSARIDLANCRLMGGEVEGATAALAPIFDLPLDRRVDWVVPRLDSLRSTMAREGWRDATPVDELEGAIEEYKDSLPWRELGSAMWG